MHPLKGGDRADSQHWGKIKQCLIDITWGGCDGKFWSHLSLSLPTMIIV